MIRPRRPVFAVRELLPWFAVAFAAFLAFLPGSARAWEDPTARADGESAAWFRQQRELREERRAEELARDRLRVEEQRLRLEERRERDAWTGRSDAALGASTPRRRSTMQ
jgi:hypothetical protein